MLFNSLAYLIFLPAVFMIYWALRRSVFFQNLFVVAASYVFYGWWDWRYMVLIGGYTLVSFSAPLLMQGRSAGVRKLILWVTVTLNLGVLGLYKYFDFFVRSFSKLLNGLGIEADWATLNLVLPVGISFFTFQALSYVIDVYRGKVPPTRNVVAYFAFLSFFPQLVAGPIERADSLLPQFLHHRRVCYSEGVDGMKQILWGLFKKMVIADNCGLAVDYIFANYESMGWGNLMLGGIFIAFQIYGDFSGYSDIAIGSARLLGIRLSDNFRFPFFSVNVAEFWRRWHISLNRWFTDYVYIPLGGSRKGLMVTLFNLMLVCGLSGLWHGANWTFIAWGLFNGALLVGYMLYEIGLGRRLRTGQRVAHTPRQPLPAWKEALYALPTALLFAFGLIIFRSVSIFSAWGYICRMLSFAEGSMRGYEYTGMVLCYLALFVLIEWIARRRRFGLDFPSTGIFRLRFVRWAVCWIMAMATFLMAGTSESFIYFQF